MAKHATLPQTDLPADAPFERLRYALHREIQSLRHTQHLAFEGRVSAHYSALIPPTGGRWIAGDTIRHSAPAELGAAGAKYCLLGWLCIATGDPGTWVEMRVLTGN